MKESKKLVGEILQDVKRDMSDEEILALLAGSKISVSPAKERILSASGRQIRSPNLPEAGPLFSLLLRYCCSGWAATCCWPQALLTPILLFC